MGPARRAARHGDRRAVARHVAPNLLHDLTTQVNSCPSSQLFQGGAGPLGLPHNCRNAVAAAAMASRAAAKVPGMLKNP